MYKVKKSLNWLYVEGGCGFIFINNWLIGSLERYVLKFYNFVRSICMCFCDCLSLGY